MGGALTDKRLLLLDSALLCLVSIGISTQAIDKNPGFYNMNAK